MPLTLYRLVFFFFNDTATTEIYTLSLHDALPICPQWGRRDPGPRRVPATGRTHMTSFERRRLVQLAAAGLAGADRKSTRLNSSHANISYAVFCLKKKKTTT